PNNQLIQVTYASGRDEVTKREIRALMKASEELKCKNLLIITWDYEDELEIEDKRIKCIPLWKWLLF
ncbi:MAG: ATP-binding protein, partial [Candidatus Brockarchaeota archaeon]|nr:ATP-binding protein [Candidatus Brockarchaeota archaeon]